jgi:hypothetical protein
MPDHLVFTWEPVRERTRGQAPSFPRVLFMPLFNLVTIYLGQPPGQMIRLYYGIKMKLMLVISDQNDSKIRPFFRRG